MIKEPLLHSHITDKLPDDHPRASTTVFCDSCGKMVHAANNECMTPWVEFDCTGGNVCLQCFSQFV